MIGHCEQIAFTSVIKGKTLLTILSVHGSIIISGEYVDGSSFGIRCNVRWIYLCLSLTPLTNSIKYELEHCILCFCNVTFTMFCYIIHNIL